ncbi:MAG: trigger factor, partial [Hyphomicrobiaceae bacterium]|nr:trigger factor [Hyphomicrobiaceae bacterium]
MQVTEASSDGLKRTITVVVPVADINARFETRLTDLKDRVQLKGFRPGHVPAVHIKKLYGRAVMGEVLDEAIKDTSLKVIEERKERPAMQPEIKLPEDKDIMTKVMDGKADLSYSMTFEVLPKVDLADFASLKLEKLTADVDAPDIEAAIARLVDGNITFTDASDRTAEDGDRVVIDFIGRIDGEAFDGGSAEDASIVIGQGQYIPGFEEGLKGAKAGDNR